MFRRRSYLTIAQYIINEFLFSFFVSFLFFFFIFFINNILLIANQVLAKNIPLLKVLQLLIYMLPQVVLFSFPFASLVGALMAVGRFSSDNEVLAMRSSGIRYINMFIPLLLISAVVSLMSFSINDYLMPLGRVKFQQLYREILFSQPDLILESNSIKEYQNSIIISGDVEGQSVNNLIIIDKDESNNKRVIISPKAGFAKDKENPMVMPLVLEDVFYHSVPKKRRQEFEYASAKKMYYNIILPNIDIQIGASGPDAKTITDLNKDIVQRKIDVADRELQLKNQVSEKNYFVLNLYDDVMDQDSGLSNFRATNLSNLFSQYADYKRSTERTVTDRGLNLYLMEFHKKLSLPMACLIFIVFAFPSGLFAKRSGKTVGFVIGLFISLLYWGMIFTAQTIGTRMNLSPFWSMWTPNFIILGFGIILYVVRLGR